MKIHPYAQRALVPSKIKAIERGIDLDAIGTFHAVEYPINGVSATWVIDGQHRQACLVKKDLGDWEVDVVVHLDIKSNESASRLFLLLNDRAAVCPADKFFNELRAGEAMAVGVTRLVESLGLRVERHASSTSISSVSALKSAYAIDHGESLSSALGLLKGAWSGRKGSLEGKLIEGLTRFLYSHKENKLDMRGFQDRLSKTNPLEIIGNARVNAKVNRQSLPIQLAEDFARIYNTKRSTGAVSVKAA